MRTYVYMLLQKFKINHLWSAFLVVIKQLVKNTFFDLIKVYKIHTILYSFTLVVLLTWSQKLS
jgi:hypothetical protein